MRRPLIVAALAVTVLVLGAAPAIAAEPVFAYLDPATSSMIISAVLGGFAAIALAVKKFGYQIKGVFRRSPVDNDEPTTEMDSTTNPPSAD